MPETTAPASCRPRITQFFEVHVWPHRARIMTIRQEPWYDEPILMVLRVGGTAGCSREDAAVATAHALVVAARASVEEPLLVTHDRHGNMTASPNGWGFPVTRLRHVQTAA